MFQLAKLNLIHNYKNPHRPLLIKGGVFDTNRLYISGSFNPEGDTNIAYINHYYTKSEQEFREKIERGRADILNKGSLDELIDIHSKNNDVYNSDAWDFFVNYI